MNPTADAYRLPAKPVKSALDAKAASLYLSKLIPNALAAVSLSLIAKSARPLFENDTLERTTKIKNMIKSTM